jgi:hypothetical protein
MNNPYGFQPNCPIFTKARSYGFKGSRSQWNELVGLIQAKKPPQNPPRSL